MTCSASFLSGAAIPQRPIGLPLGCPPGWEYLGTAAKRTGYTKWYLRKILRFAGVRPTRVWKVSDGHGGRKLDAIASRAVDAAVARWEATEVLSKAAASRGLTYSKMVTRLQAAGVKLHRADPKRPHWSDWRVETTEIERALREWDAKHGGTVTVWAEAKRWGIYYRTITKWLRQAGLKPTHGRVWEFRPEVLEGVIREALARPNARARARRAAR